MITIQEHKQAVKESERLKNIQNVKTSKLQTNKTKIEDKYWKLERKLQDKKWNELREIGEQKEKSKKEIEEKINPYSEKLNEFERIIKFMDINKKEVDLDIELYRVDYPRDENGNVIRTGKYKYNYPKKEKVFIKPLSILRDNKFCKIAIYIYENSKPKNKYTLCIIGKSIFYTRGILNFEWGYLSDVNENGHFKKELKYMPQLEDLFKWFGKNQGKILNKEINKIDETIKEYKEVIKNTNSKEWEIAYLENRKDNYENRYSRGTETEEYAQTIKELTNLTTGKTKEKYVKILKDLMLNKLNTEEN